jgi:hypothetical protein
MKRLSQEVLAAKVGRDQGYISRLLRLDALPERIQHLRSIGVLSDAAASELLPLSPYALEDMAGELEQRAAGGAPPLTQREAREMARPRKRSSVGTPRSPTAHGPLVVASADIVQPELWIEGLDDTERELRIALLMHDLRAALEVETEGRSDVAPDVTRLLRDLHAPSLVAFMEEYAAHRLER